MSALFGTLSHMRGGDDEDAFVFPFGTRSSSRDLRALIILWMSFIFSVGLCTDLSMTDFFYTVTLSVCLPVQYSNRDLDENRID